MSAARKHIGTLGKHFLRTIASTNYGRVLLSAWIGNVVFILLAKKRKRERRQKSVSSARVSSKRSSAIVNVLRIIARHAFTYNNFVFHLVLYVLSLCSRVYLTIRLADMGGALAGYMGARRFTKMFETQAKFGLFSIAAAANTMCMKFFQRRVEFSVRDILTRHLVAKYMDERRLSFYNLELDDAPTRLSVDVSLFSEKVTHTLGHALKPIIDVVQLTMTLSQRIGLAPLISFYGFFWASKNLLQRVHRILPRSTKRCAIDQRRIEAKFHQHTQRIHSYREQIAFQRGTNRELASLVNCAQTLQKDAFATHCAQAFVDFQTNYTLKFGGMMCAYSVLIPKVYLDPSMKSPEKIIALFASSSNLLAGLANAVKDLAESMNELGPLRGLATRVWLLDSAIEEIPLRESSTLSASASKIRLENVCIGPPRASASDPPLVKNLNLSISRGDTTVVRGKNGCGKSSLFRTMMGLWPPVREPPTHTKKNGSRDNAILATKRTASKALIEVPIDTFVVPQDCYFPTDGSLRAQITYPEPPSNISKEDAVRLLVLVGLEDLPKRFDLDDENSLDTFKSGEKADESIVTTWNEVLSGGQKQRLAWCRLFYHKPTFGLVDEATSAISADMASKLYTMAKDMGITLVSISHHKEIDDLHAMSLDLTKNGTYRHSHQTF